MLEALFWGAVGGASLLIGAIIAMTVTLPRRATAAIMGFGAGVLVSVVAHELTAAAFRHGGSDVLALGTAVGALTFYGANRLLARRGAGDRKRAHGEHPDGSGTAIALGTVLDGIPESAVIGISLLAGHGVGVAVVAAIFLSNLPESISASTGLLSSGMGRARLLGLWLLVLTVSALSSLAGYALLGDASSGVVGFIEAFAAGAILVMLADTMLPEAVEEGGNSVGLVTVAGFVVSFLLSQQA